MNKTFGIIILVVVAFGVYLNSLNYGFFWEDKLLTKDNIHIRTLKNIPYFFLPGYVNVYELGHGDRYRPLRTLSFVFDYFIWRENTFGYHLTNVGLHILTTILVALLVTNLSGNNLAGFFAGLIFAVHPVHTESILFVKNRSDIICALFFLLALLFFGKFIDSKKYLFYVLSLIATVFGFLSKEMIIILPFLITGIVVIKGQKINHYFTIPYYLLLFGYLIFRKYVMIAGFGNFSSVFPSGFLDHIGFVLTTFSEYIRVLFWPVSLCVDKVIPIGKSPLNLWFFVFVMVIIGLFFAIKKKEKQIAFWIFFLLFTMLPVSNIIYLVGRPFAEQRMYIPSIGFSAFVALAIMRLANEKIKFAWIVVGMIVLFLGVRTVLRVSDWRDEENLWKEATKVSLAPFRAYHNLAYLQIERGDYSEAMENLKKSLEINPKFADAYSTLGALYYRLGLYKKSVEMFEKALEVSAGFNETVLTNLAAVYAVLGQHQKAREIYQKIIKITPWLERAYYNYAVSLIATNEYDEALKNLNECLRLNPYYTQAYLRRGEILMKKGDFLQAEKDFSTVLRQEPKNSLAKIYLAQMRK